MSPLRAMRRYLLPSRSFGWYTARLFAVRLLGLGLGVAVLLQMLDVMEAGDAILAVSGNDGGDVWRYSTLRFPDRLSRFLPFSALLAALFTLAQLNRHSEIVVMKASGLSAHRILLPMGLVCGVVASGHFLLDQTVVAPARSELTYWQQHDYAANLPPPPEVLNEVWLVEDSKVISVGAVSRSGSRVLLDRVSIYRRGQTGLLTSLIQADFAWYSSGKWTLFSVREFDVASHELTLDEARNWDLNLGPERFFSISVTPEHVGFFELRETIRKLGAEGQPVDSLRTSLYQKIASPAASLLMPLLGAIAGFGVYRRGRLFARVAAGMALGFSFFVADNLMVALGQFGTVPPIFAAFGPIGLFLTVGFALLFYTEE